MNQSINDIKDNKNLKLKLKILYKPEVNTEQQQVTYSIKWLVWY